MLSGLEEVDVQDKGGPMKRYALEPSGGPASAGTAAIAGGNNGG